MRLLRRRKPRLTADERDRNNLEEAAWRAYWRDEIDSDEYARAMDHIARGGRGNAEFPYLPVFRAMETEGELR